MNVRWMERPGAWLLPMLVFSLPFAHTTALRNLLAGLLTLLVLSWSIGRQSWPGPSRLLFAWLGVALLSVAWSIDPLLSASEFAAGALLPMGCCWAAWTWLNDEGRARWMTLAMLAGLIAILSLRIAVLVADFQATAPIQGLYDIYWPGRGVASTISIFALSMAVLAFYGNQRRLGIAILVIALAVGAQNWNRMFWLAALMTAVPAFVLAGRPGPLRWLWVCIGLALVVSGLAYSLWLKFPELTWIEIVLRTFSDDVRWDMWQQWAGVIGDRPLLGYGFGQKLVQQAGSGQLEPWVWELAHVHNVLGNILVQLGLLGIVVYLAMLGRFLRGFGRALRQPASRPAAVAGISLITGMLAKNMTDDFMQYAALILFWILLGMYARLAGVGRREA